MIQSEALRENVKHLEDVVGNWEFHNHRCEKLWRSNACEKFNCCACAKEKLLHQITKLFIKTFKFFWQALIKAFEWRQCNIENLRTDSFDNELVSFDNTREITERTQATLIIFLVTSYSQLSCLQMCKLKTCNIFVYFREATI